MPERETKIIIAGFGGQGVIVAGQILAQACIFENKNVTAMVSYGAEMRGGTANCTLVISDDEIASPIVEKSDVAVIMNQPSLDKFAGSVVPNGLILLNTSLIEKDFSRDDVEILQIRASETAQSLGNVRAANIVCLGALCRKTGLLSLESLAAALKHVFGDKGAKVVKLNEEAMKAGAGMADR